MKDRTSPQHFDLSLIRESNEPSSDLMRKSLQPPMRKQEGKRKGSGGEGVVTHSVFVSNSLLS